MTGNLLKTIQKFNFLSRLRFMELYIRYIFLVLLGKVHVAQAMVDVESAHVTDNKLQLLSFRGSNVQTIGMLKKSNIFPIAPRSSENNDDPLRSLHRLHALY